MSISKHVDGLVISDSLMIFIFTCGVANRSCSCEFSSFYLLLSFYSIAPCSMNLLTISLVHTYGDSNHDSSTKN